MGQNTSQYTMIRTIGTLNKGPFFKPLGGRPRRTLQAEQLGTLDPDAGLGCGLGCVLLKVSFDPLTKQQVKAAKAS